MRFQKILARFSAAFSELRDQAQKTPSGLFVPAEADVLLGAAERMTSIVQEGGEKEINPARFASFTDSALRLVREMKFDQRDYGFLTKGSAARELRKKIIELDFETYLKHQVRIEGKFSAWESLSAVPKIPLGELREAYEDAVATVDGLRREAVKSRIHLVLAPAPSKPAPDSKRDKRLRDAEIRTSMKGTTNGKKKQKQAIA